MGYVNLFWVTYLPEFRLADPEVTRTVTVRNLLAHTISLTRTDNSLFGTSITAGEVIAAAANMPLVARPGDRLVYSNVNTIVAGAVIEPLTSP